MNWILTSLITFTFLFQLINAQQNYSGNAVLNCKNSTFLYTCNGKHSTCTSFLIFTSRFPYNTIPSIAALTSSDQYEIARLNNVTRFTVLPPGQEVIVPVSCSCSGQYYKSSTTYEVTDARETYYTIANDTYQGLSTCRSLIHANGHSESNLHIGRRFRVPLRCACPTSRQIAKGTKYLMTYPIHPGDILYSLGQRFNVSVTSISEANGFADENTSIYPDTTILIPLPSEPSGSQTTTRSYKPATIPKPAVVTRKGRAKKGLLAVAMAAAAFSLLILVAFLALIFLFHKKRTPVQEGNLRNLKIPSQEELIVEIAKLDHSLKIFKFMEIKKATRNFGSKNRIKGCMYRGTFGKEVLAVKKIKANAQNEVNMLYQLNHSNIVQLRGFCQHEENSYLVYEYLKSGSLQEWLTKRGSKDKSWKKRVQIALDVSNGLLYLHSYTKPGYVHNNISSSNILLDSNLRAKITNFSLATTAEAECVDTSLVTAKVDVFSFGVVLLELIVGKYTEFAHDRSGKLLSSVIIRNQNAEADLRTLIEPCLAEKGGMEYATQIVKLSLSCLSQDPADRPSMVEIVSVLRKLQYYLNKAVAVDIS